MAMDPPVVATRHGAIPEAVLHERTGEVQVIRNAVPVDPADEAEPVGDAVAAARCLHLAAHQPVADDDVDEAGVALQRGPRRGDDVERTLQRLQVRNVRDDDGVVFELQQATQPFWPRPRHELIRVDGILDDDGLVEAAGGDRRREMPCDDDQQVELPVLPKQPVRHRWRDRAPQDSPHHPALDQHRARQRVRQRQIRHVPGKRFAARDDEVRPAPADQHGEGRADLRALELAVGRRHGDVGRAIEERDRKPLDADPGMALGIRIGRTRIPLFDRGDRPHAVPPRRQRGQQLPAEHRRTARVRRQRANVENVERAVTHPKDSAAEQVIPLPSAQPSRIRNLRKSSALAARLSVC